MKQFFLGALCASALVTNAFGSLVLLSPNPIDLNGTGLGAVNTVLTLNNTNNVSSGCVAPGSGSSSVSTGCGFTNNTVQTGNAQIGTPTLASLGVLNLSNLQIIFNANEPGNAREATVNQLALTLYGATGNTATFTLPSLVNLNPTLSGIGNSGFIFGLDTLQASQADTFLGAAANGGATGIRIGLGASLSNVTGGPDTFFVRNNPSGGGFSDQVPEPASMLLFGSGLVAVALLKRRRQAR